LVTIDANVDSILEDTGTTIPASITNLDGDVADVFDDVGGVKAELDIVLADTNEIQTELADGGRTDLLIDAILLDTGTTLDGKINTIDDLIDTEVAAIKTVVDEILVDTGTTLEGHLTGIKGAGWVNENLVTIDANVDAVLADTGTDIPATLATVAKTGADADTLKTLSDQLDGLSGMGMGSETWTYTLTESESSEAIVDAFVEVSSDAGGATIVDRGITNASGTVTFHLDPGTYYLWRYKYGYTFTNPDVEEVP
jgi:hypothetical protein